MGLRYDLTLPLSRYFANNRNDLLSPFKVIQMDRVYRAERPQKGRLREFMQCDIDILGNSSPDAEVELILTTAKALKAIGIDKFKELFDMDETFPDEEEDGYTTLAGFILSISGTVPDVKDKYQWERFCFEIVDLDGHQIDKILVTDLGEDYINAEEEED